MMTPEKQVQLEQRASQLYSELMHLKTLHAEVEFAKGTVEKIGSSGYLFTVHINFGEVPSAHIALGCSALDFNSERWRTLLKKVVVVRSQVLALVQDYLAECTHEYHMKLAEITGEPYIEQAPVRTARGIRLREKDDNDTGTYPTVDHCSDAEAIRGA